MTAHHAAGPLIADTGGINAMIADATALPYLRRFATELTVIINTAAAGGNASLLAEPEE